MSNNVISLDRARQLRQEAEFHLAFPHMYVDFDLSVRAMLEEISWLADNEFIPEGLLQAFETLDCAARDAMILLAAYIEEETHGG